MSSNKYLDLSGAKSAHVDMSFDKDFTIIVNALPDQNADALFFQANSNGFHIDASGIQTDTFEKPPLGSSPLNPAASPQHLIQEGITQDGWYYIKRGSNTYYLFCDLTTEDPSGRKGYILFLAYRGNSNYTEFPHMGNDMYVVEPNETVPFPVQSKWKQYKIALPESDFPNLSNIAMSVDHVSYSYSYPFHNDPNKRYFKHVLSVDASGENSSVHEPFQYWVRNTGHFVDANEEGHFGLRYADRNAWKTVTVHSASSNGAGAYSSQTRYMIQNIDTNDNFSSWVLSTNQNTPWSGSNTNGEWGAYRNYSTLGHNDNWGWDNRAIYAFAYFDDTVTPVPPVIPSEWHQYALRYQADQGRLEYIIDGKPIASSTSLINNPYRITLSSGKFYNLIAYDRMVSNHAIRNVDTVMDTTHGELGSKTNPAASPQELLDSGITSSGSYWLSIEGTPVPHFVDLDTNSRKGYVLLASSDASGNWNVFSSQDKLTSMGSNGTYSLTGTIGDYSQEYNVFDYGITHFMVRTGTGEYWAEFPMSKIRDSNSNSFTISAGSLPGGTTSMYSYSSDGKHIELYYGSSSDNAKLFWADNDNSNASFKNSNGGVQLYGFMGNIQSSRDDIHTKGSRSFPFKADLIPKGLNGTHWVDTGDSVIPMYFESHVDRLHGDTFVLVSSVAGGTNTPWGNWDSGDGQGGNNLDGTAQFGTYLHGDFLSNFEYLDSPTILLKTADGTHWVAFQRKDLYNLSAYYGGSVPAGLYDIPLTGCSSNLSIDADNVARSRVYLKYDGTPDSPYISLDPTFVNYTFWGENSSTIHTGFKNLHGGIKMFVGGELKLGFSSKTPAQSTSHLLGLGYQTNGSYWLDIDGSATYVYCDLEMNDSAGYAQVAHVTSVGDDWPLQANNILLGLVDDPLDLSTGNFSIAFSGLPFNSYLLKTGDQGKYIEFYREDLLQNTNTSQISESGSIPLLSCHDPNVNSAYVTRDVAGQWIITLGDTYDPSNVFWASSTSDASQNVLDLHLGMDLYIGRTPEPKGRYWRIECSGNTEYVFEELNLFSSYTEGHITSFNHPETETVVSVHQGASLTDTDISYLTNGKYTFETPLRFSATDEALVFEYDFGTVKEPRELIVAAMQSCTLKLYYSIDKTNWDLATTLEVPGEGKGYHFQKLHQMTWVMRNQIRLFNQDMYVSPHGSDDPYLRVTLDEPTSLDQVYITKGDMSIFPNATSILMGSNDDVTYDFVGNVRMGVHEKITYPSFTTTSEHTSSIKEDDVWNFALSGTSLYKGQAVQGQNVHTTIEGLLDNGYQTNIDIGNDVRTVEFEIKLQDITQPRVLAKIQDVFSLELVSHNSQMKFMATDYIQTTAVNHYLNVPLQTTKGYSFIFTWNDQGVQAYVNGTPVVL